MANPLEGIKVVELATFVAAPVVGRMLADMGAQVTKIEAPAGDGWRNSGPGVNPARFNKKTENPVFDIYNTGKEFVSLNLKTPEGKEAFFKLLDEADIFITNTRPAALKRLGLDYETLKEKYPRLIYAIVQGFGEKGPDKDVPAFDTTAFWSRGGFFRDLAPKNSEESYSPINAPGGVGDSATGYLLFGEIVTALYNREKTGKGDFVRSTLYHNAIFMFGTMLIRLQRPYGGAYPRSRVDHGLGGGYECADGAWVYVPSDLDELCDMLGIKELLDDPRADPKVRYTNRHFLHAQLKAAFLTQPHEYWVEEGKRRDIPLVHMAHFADVVEDPQAWANDFLEHVAFPSGNTDVMPTSHFEMASFTPPKTKPAPVTGADTAKVLARLGYTEKQIEAMLASGAAMAAKE